MSNSVKVSLRKCVSCGKMSCRCNHAKVNVGINDTFEYSELVLNYLLGWLRTETSAIRLEQNSHRALCVIETFDGKIGIGVGTYPGFAVAKAMEKLGLCSS